MKNDLEISKDMNETLTKHLRKQGIAVWSVCKKIKTHLNLEELYNVFRI